MNTIKFAALVLAVFAGWSGPAAAVSVDYSLTIPLIDLDATERTPTNLLTGTLSYDGDRMSGSGTFSLVGALGSVTDTFAGFAFLTPTDDATGVLFAGSAANGAGLYVNVAARADADPLVSGFVNYCPAGCTMFQSVGATIGLGAVAPQPPGEVLLPGPIVSPVPLPPGAALFATALLVLAGLGATPTRSPRLQAAGIRRRDRATPPRPGRCGSPRTGR